MSEGLTIIEKIRSREKAMAWVQESINNSLADRLSLKRSLIQSATTAMADFPQYAFLYEQTEEWNVVRLNKNIVTKGGTAFKKGDIAIVRPRRPCIDLPVEGPVWDSWSVRNNCLTIIPLNATVEIL